MIREIREITCDFCGKTSTAFDDLFNFVRIEFFDSSVVKASKCCADICHDCFAKMADSMQPGAKSELFEKFGYLERKVKQINESKNS